MVQLRDGLSLRAEPRRLFAGGEVGIAHHFHGHHAPQLQTFRLIHNAHPTAGDLPHQPVAAKLTGQGQKALWRHGGGTRQMIGIQAFL